MKTRTSRSRQNRFQARGTIGGHYIKIGGKNYNINFARIVFRCKECLGGLRKKDTGLVCKIDQNHQGFIHRDEAAKVAAEQQEQINQIKAVYEIKDGKITVKE